MPSSWSERGARSLRAANSGLFPDWIAALARTAAGTTRAFLRRGDARPRSLPDPVRAQAPHGAGIGDRAGHDYLAAPKATWPGSRADGTTEAEGRYPPAWAAAQGPPDPQGTSPSGVRRR